MLMSYKFQLIVLVNFNKLKHLSTYQLNTRFLIQTMAFCRYIRCWDAKLGHEIYRITVGLGGLGSGPDLCVWSLLSLRYKAEAVFCNFSVIICGF